MSSGIRLVNAQGIVDQVDALSRSNRFESAPRK